MRLIGDTENQLKGKSPCGRALETIATPKAHYANDLEIRSAPGTYVELTFVR